MTDQPADQPPSEGATDAPVEKRRRLGRTRSALSVLVGVIAVIGVLATVFGVWIRAVATDSDQLGRAVENALREPEVNQALATYVNTQIYEVIDVSARLDSVLPGALAPVSRGVELALQNRTQGRLEELFASDQVVELVGDLASRAHSQLVDVLRGGGLVDGITVESGQVTVNLLPLLGLGFGLVQEAGLLENLAFPELTRDGDPAQQVAALEQFTGRDLPDDFGQLVVYESDSVANASEVVSNAQRAVVVARRALVLTAVITIVAFAGSILLARRRLRAAVALLLSSAVVLVLARVVIRRVVAEIPSVVKSSGAKAAVGSILDTLTTSLMRLSLAVVVVAVVVAVVAFFSGSSKTATGFRDRAGGPGASLMDVVAAHRVAFAILLGALFVGNFMLLDINIVSILIGLALLLLIGAALWAPAPNKGQRPAPDVTS